MKRYFILFAAGLIILLFLACSLPTQLGQALRMTISPSAGQPTNFLTAEMAQTLTEAHNPVYLSGMATLSVRQSQTALALGNQSGGQGGNAADPPTPTPEPCGFMWAYQSLPEVTAGLQAAYRQAGIQDITVFAQAFGENCVTSSGEISYFATMETDIRLDIPVAGLLENRELLGDRLEKALVVLLDFPSEQLPGNPGKVEAHFVATDGESTIRFQLTSAAAALEQGIHGEELYLALQE